ncbi:hypothetical protein CLIB1423_01S07162 [[Candida] railenensis]|uniref:ARID domain-containing protein n=1 Tax=[Candida] railenensis TaxID=45579 RepID=A0A9P0VVI1_9ASCO|nr:hypothetical protein CLIB1423_01S07162 [[Candida] railenensis]
MNDNFWFNDNAFSNNQPNNGGNNNNEEDFLSNLFDGPMQQQSQQQPQQPAQHQQQQPQAPAQQLAPQMLDVNPMEMGGGGGQNMNPQMFLRQQQQQQQSPQHQQGSQQHTPQSQSQQQVPIHQQMGQQGNVQGPRANQSIEQNKRDQILKMKQQIMQQQMLAAQKQKQQQHQQQQQQHQQQQQQNQQQQQQQQLQEQLRLQQQQIQQNIPQQVHSPSVIQQSPQLSNMKINQFQRAQAAMRLKNMERQESAGPIGSNASARSAVPTPQQSSQPFSPVAMNTPQQQQAHTPQQIGIDAQKQGSSPPQLAQFQIELFLSTLYDFMTRRGTPITQAPVINNKKVNLFFLYFMCQKLGGSQQLLRNLPDGARQQSPWALICQKLGLFENVDEQNATVKSKIIREVYNCFMQLLLPYEQYTNTPDGHKDIQQRKIQFQKQIAKKMQQQQAQQIQQQQQQQPAAPIPQPSQVQPQIPAHVSAHNSPLINSQTPQHIQSPAANNFTPNNILPNSVNSPMGQSQAPTPQQRKLSRISNNNTSSHNSPVLVQTKSRAGSAVNTPPVQPTVSLAPTPAAIPEDKKEPNAIRSYLPIRRPIETHAGYDIRALSQVAGEIEITKPVYLFAPELGSVNIHALIMSLKTFTGVGNSEVSSALNTLLVTTSDANLVFKISDCPELLDTLSVLGLKVLDVIMEGDKKGKKRTREVYESGVKLSSNSNIEDIFNRYVKQKRGAEDDDEELVEEDIEFVVNSLTGEVIVDEDENGEEDSGEDDDEEEEQLFSPTNESSYSTTSGDLDEDSSSTFGLSDYMSSLLAFRKENKYHFSKIQTKSANDDKIMFVDQLITITMILRNISFGDSNKILMSSNSNFKDLLFKIVKSVASQPDYFVFNRKILCLLKDCLLILNKIAFTMELRSLEETFLVFLLTTSFGPKIEDDESIPYANLEVYSYMSFGIDTFTKLLVREPHNRSLLQAVLNGSLSVSSSASIIGSTGGIGNVAPLNITTEDQEETARLIKLYLGERDQDKYSSGILLTRSFQFFISVIPFQFNNFELSKFLLLRSPTISQALFGTKIIIDMVSNSGSAAGTEIDSDNTLRLLPSKWIFDHKELILSNLLRVCLNVVGDTAKIPRHTDEHKILSLVILRALIMINSLVSDLVVVKSELDQGEGNLKECAKSTTEFKEKLSQIKEIARIIPDKNLSLEALLNPGIDPDVGKEVIRLMGMMNELFKEEK